MKPVTFLIIAWCVAAQDGPVFRSETNVVEAYVSVLDKRGNPVPNLTQDQFVLTDGGQVQSLLAFEGTAAEGAKDRLSVALLLDVTGSMDEFLPLLKNSASRFVDELSTDQSIAVYAFSNGVQSIQNFTTDKRAVKQSVMRIRAGGATAVFDAVARVSKDLETRPGKKALILFTDGQDNASSLTSGGASRRAKAAGVPLYTIAQGEALQNKALLNVLEEVAADTGGLSLEVKRPSDITAAFASVNRNLQHTYLLAWKAPQNPGTAWREIRVALPKMKDAVIRARQGYFPNP